MVEIAVAILTLTLLEIVLGIDNIIVIAIVAGKLPAAQQPRARRVGLAAALVTRLLLLASLSYILGLTQPVFTLPKLPFLDSQEAREISWRDIILIVGGLFLIAKSTYEIHDKLAVDESDEEAHRKSKAGFAGVIVQIALLDIIFSLDSVITAVGMVNQNIALPGGGEFNRLWVMVIAVVIAVGVMLIFAGPVSDFIARNPTFKILALSFLILIGVLLVADGFGQHMNKGYIYFAMAFSATVEMLNLRLRRRKSMRLRGENLPPV